VTQNISGWLKIKVKATAGSKLTAKHAEILQPNGDLHTQPLRHARATDSWIFNADGEYELEPKQTFHGFQYADLIAEGGVEILAVTGVAISSDNSVRGQIETSHSGINWAGPEMPRHSFTLRTLWWTTSRSSEPGCATLRLSNANSAGRFRWWFRTS
jgi:hypothetical protein